MVRMISHNAIYSIRNVLFVFVIAFHIISHYFWLFQKALYIVYESI